MGKLSTNLLQRRIENGNEEVKTNSIPIGIGKI
jgi:hypothetical protein